MRFAERLIAERSWLVAVNSVVTLVAVAVVEAADFDPLWVVGAALASGAVTIGVTGLASGPGRGTTPPKAPTRPSPAPKRAT